MRIDLLKLSFLSLAMAAALPAMAQELPKPIFHLPFDGDADASIAGGPAKPLSDVKLSFADGVKGKALIVPQDALKYSETGNLKKGKGSLTLWFKPNWMPCEQVPMRDRHCLFSEPNSEKRASGSLWLWFEGCILRGDVRDAKDSYITTPVTGLVKDSWMHVGLTWDSAGGSVLYLNGTPVYRTRADSFKLVPGKTDFSAVKTANELFFVGSQEGKHPSDGFIDELKIYDCVLTPEQVSAEMAQLCPVKLDCLTKAFPEGQAGDLRWRIANISGKPFQGAPSWCLSNDSGSVAASGVCTAVSVKPGESIEFSEPVPAMPKGHFNFIMKAPGCPSQGMDIWELGAKSPYSAKLGEMKTQLLEEIDLVKGLPQDRFVVKGNECKIGALNGRKYFEGGVKRNDRFAIKLTLPEADAPYLIEWEYPDDKLRTMEMVLQDAKESSNDYSLQTGVFCGGEYSNSMKFITHRSVFWAKSKDSAIIFMTARDNGPVAVAGLKISRIIGGLPDAGVKRAPAVNGWSRIVGIHYEDPAFNYDFGVPVGDYMPRFEESLDRLVAYMKWSGQNFLSYPAIWYEGRINTSHQPRAHDADYIGCILAKFSANGFGFMPTINLQKLPVSMIPAIADETYVNGELNKTNVMIHSSGKPNFTGWHGTPPNFNPLHPDVQQYIESNIDDMLERYGDSPAFKGVIMHLTTHTVPWFGSLNAGYNDYNIDAFEKATGLKVRVDRKDPMRGKLYYEWLMAHAKEKWIEWRCQAIAEFYKRIAAKMAAKRPDLRLSLCTYNPTMPDREYRNDPRIDSPDFVWQANREAGLDAKCYADSPNIILEQTIYPSDYRHYIDEKGLAKGFNFAMTSYFKEGTYAIPEKAMIPWINLHDRYFEDGIGGFNWWGKVDPIKGVPWLSELKWRVSVLNPNRNFFLEHYMLPLRYTDVLGFTKGGFLIGTCGVEDKLAEFSRAFCALPAVRFSDVKGSSETVKVRSFNDGASLWVYVANTSNSAANVEIPLQGLSDASTGASIEASGASTKLAMEPYKLRSFKAPASARLGSVKVL